MSLSTKLAVTKTAGTQGCLGLSAVSKLRLTFQVSGAHAWSRVQPYLNPSLCSLLYMFLFVLVKHGVCCSGPLL